MGLIVGPAVFTGQGKDGDRCQRLGRCRLLLRRGRDEEPVLRVREIVGHRNPGPLARPLEAKLGAVQQFTPTIDALYVPNIDDSLDEQQAKRDFWAAFRVLGDWYAAQPPY